jgi:hypothetical protein
MSIPWCSYHQALQPDGVSPLYFTNKIVYVGGTPIIGAHGVTGDSRPTPFGGMPGVEIQATAFLNLWRNEWLAEVSPWMELIVVVFLGVSLGLVLCLIRPWTAAVVAIGAFVALILVAIWLVWQHQLWFPWLIPGAVQIPVALGWAILANTRKVYHEKEVLEHTLATAHLEPVHLRTTPLDLGIAHEQRDPAHDGRTIVVSPPAGPRVLPKVMADHELVRFIGGGAYGEVWLARNVIGLYRAFKIIRREKFRDDAPFQREFRGLQKFMPVSTGHPGLVQILHVGKNEPEGFFFYIMEPGDDETAGQTIDPENYTPKSFATLVRNRGRLPVAEAIDLILPLCDALDYLHGQSLIHRDIKPANIIFVKGAPKLADIGLVTEVSVEDRDVSWVGTDGYIPPEGPGSAMADVYSLGKVLYVLALGADPRSWPALSETLLEGTQQPEILALNPILLKACAGPRERYKTAGEMRIDLLRVRGQLADAVRTRT